MAAVLYGTRKPHFFYGRHVHGCHKCLRNRTCDSCDGDALDDDRKADRSDTDPDRGSGADFSGQYYFYKSEKENIAEEPACYPGVL